MLSVARLTLAFLALSATCVSADSDTTNQVPATIPGDTIEQLTAAEIENTEFLVQLYKAPGQLLACSDDPSVGDGTQCVDNGVQYTPQPDVSVFFNQFGVEVSNSQGPTGANGLTSTTVAKLTIDGSGNLALYLPAGLDLNIFDGAEIGIVDPSSPTSSFFAGFQDADGNFITGPSPVSPLSSTHTGTCSQTLTKPTLQLTSSASSLGSGSVQINVVGDAIDGYSADPSSSGCSVTYTWGTVIDDQVPCPNNAHSGSCADPQFVGFLGQSYQVHGVAGNIYNIISTPQLQLNALFTFLESGKCRKGTQCFGHPGNYFGEVGLALKSESGAAGLIRVVAGPVDQGLTVLVNDVVIPVSDNVVTVSGVTIKLVDPFEVSVQTTEFVFRFQNSDMFLNEDVAITPELMTSIMSFKRSVKAGNSSASDSSLPHGLLGQTWQRKTYSNRWKHIEGQLFDYAVADGVFGTEFKYNRF